MHAQKHALVGGQCGGPAGLLGPRCSLLNESSHQEPQPWGLKPLASCKEARHWSKLDRFCPHGGRAGSSAQKPGLTKEPKQRVTSSLQGLC